MTEFLWEQTLRFHNDIIFKRIRKPTAAKDEWFIIFQQVKSVIKCAEKLRNHFDVNR